MEEATPVFEDPPPSRAQGLLIRDGYSMLTDVLGEPMHELSCEAEITPAYFVVFDVFPFAAGAQRLAFKGSIFERQPGREPAFRVHVVVKMEMAHADTVAKSADERTAMCADEAAKTVKKHDCVTEYVKQWCELGINKSVYVLSTETIKVTKGCSLSDIDAVRFPMLHHLFKKLSLDTVLYRDAVGTVEDYMPGKFTKFLNNDGHPNHNVVANFPEAFAHWTWVVSGGKLMVSDIQGVRTGGGYILTDPCVHSVMEQEGYGMSDLGMLGVEEFFDKHHCNDLCTDLSLGKDGKDLDLGHSMRTRLNTAARVSSDSSKGEYWVAKRRSKRKNSEGVPTCVMAAGQRGEGADDKGMQSQPETPSSLEQTQGKVQRRATLRAISRKSKIPSEEVASSWRRKTFSTTDDFRKLKKRDGSKGDIFRNRRGDDKHEFFAGLRNLFRLKRRAHD